MEFKKYCSIENSYRVKYLNDIVEYGLTYGEWVVTEKVHGSNLSFWMDQTGVKAAKRSGFLTYGNRFFNFQEVMDSYEKEFEVLFQAVMDIYGIPFEKLEIALYGEIFGGTYPHDGVDRVPNAVTVQKGVFYAPFNDFYAYDMKVNGRYINVDVFEEIMENVGFFYAKHIYKGFFKDVLAYPNEFPTKIPGRLELPDIEGNVCEGVVIKPVIARQFPNGERVILKNKNEKFSEILHSKKSKTPKVPEDISLLPEEEEIYKKALSYINENRLRNVLSHIGTVTDKMFGKVQGLFMQDVMEDFRKDHAEEMDKLEKKRIKIIQKRINMDVQAMVRANFLNIIDGTY